MTQQAELLRKIDALPPKYFGEVIDFVGYLQKKAQNEDNRDKEIAWKNENDQQTEGTQPDQKLAEYFEYWKKTYPSKIVEMLMQPAPIADKLLGIIAGTGDITYEQIREERLAEKYGV